MVYARSTACGRLGRLSTFHAVHHSGGANSCEESWRRRRFREHRVSHGGMVVLQSVLLVFSLIGTRVECAFRLVNCVSNCSCDRGSTVAIVVVIGCLSVCSTNQRCFGGEQQCEERDYWAYRVMALRIIFWLGSRSLDERRTQVFMVLFQMTRGFHLSLLMQNG